VYRSELRHTPAKLTDLAQPACGTDPVGGDHTMFGTILLAVAGSPHAERAAELVRRLAGESGDAVVVLHVTEIMPIRGGIDVELDQDHEAIEAADRYGRELELAGVPVKVELVRRWPGGWPGSSSSRPEHMRPARIGMGSHGRGTWWRCCSAAWSQGRPPGRPSCADRPLRFRRR
jgi:nucleotide-binding universal stress UspA family protein